ncbi:MAG: acetylglutamate kinase [Acidimicrobiia bacterium]
MNPGRDVASTQYKASVLIEALAYIKAYSNKTVVIKLGGAAMTTPSLAEAFAEDMALMRLVGIRPVVVHGGGRQISEMMTKLGMQPRFVGGLRVSDEQTVEVARMVLLGHINRRIVGLINRHGDLAMGLSGEDGNLFVTRRRLGPGGEDLGLVGEVEEVRPGVVLKLLDDGLIPVIAPLGVSPDGEVHNINADTAAGAIAIALGAEKLVYLTDVRGLYEDLGDEESLLSEVSLEELERMLQKGKLSEGMLPKISSCLTALKGGVPRAHILDGRVEHAVLLEVFTPEGIGTMARAPGSPTEKEFRSRGRL